MPVDFHHGVRVIEVTEGTRPIRTINSAVIGMVCTADDADATAFPLNTPVLLTSVRAAAADAGTTGTLSKALKAIQDQIGALTIVVRVDEGLDEAETTTNAVAGAGKLRDAKAMFGFHPRILGAPGIDTQAVTTELVSVADDVRGFVYARAIGADKDEAITYRGNFGSERLMLIWPEFKAWDSVASAEADVSAVAYALGLRAKIDEEQGWHKSLSNVVVNGVTGITDPVFFDLQNPNSDAGVMNASEVTTLVNVEGYRFWGNRTAGSEPKFAFEVARRTGDIIADTIAEAHLWAIDKPMSKKLINDIVEGVNAKLREWKTLGYIVGGECWVDPELNTVEVLEAGKLYVDYDYTPVPPLENLNFQQRITSQYLSELVSG